MAVFRAVENRRSVVRATASGQTCGIAPDGRIIALAPPFTEARLTVAIPVIKGDSTVYTRRGDFLAVMFCAAAAVLLISGGVVYSIRTAKRRKG
jgi:apolipoprotein N-acyltransferase